MNLYEQYTRLIEDTEEEFDEPLPAAIQELIDIWDKENMTDLEYSDSVMGRN